MTKLDVWCGVHQVLYLVPVVMVDCGLDRLNKYHLLSCWNTWRQETIITRWYNWNPWMCGTIVKLVLFLGSEVLLHVLVIPIIMLLICFVILWIIFLCVVETSGGQWGGIFTRSSGLIHFVTNLIYCMGMEGFGFRKLCYIMWWTYFCISKWHTRHCEVWWKSTVLISCSSLFLFIYTMWKW